MVMELDPAAISRLRKAGGEAFLRKMIGLFLEHGTRRRDDAVRAAQSNDLPALAHAVHSLKSSAANFGANALQGLAERIEQAAQNGHAAAALSMMRDLDDAFSQTVDRLQQLQKEEPS